MKLFTSLDAKDLFRGILGAVILAVVVIRHIRRQIAARRETKGETNIRSGPILFASLEAKDRKLLIGWSCVVVVLAVVTALNRELLSDSIWAAAFLAMVVDSLIRRRIAARRRTKSETKIRGGPILFASLDPKDRKLLIGCLCAVVVLAVVTALFARDESRDDNHVPSTYLTGRHGARAAFEMLQSNGYNVERWEHLLSELAEKTDAQTVVIFAEPHPTSPEDFRAAEDIVARGGRVLLTGQWGGILAPGGNVQPSTQFQAACKLTPQGLDPLASSGEVWMAPEASWGLNRPLDRIEFNCSGAPAVVEYTSGKGQVIWWASSTPLENGSIQRAENLNLFLNSLGAPQNHRFYWDESLHGEIYSNWYYAGGAALNLLRFGLLGIGLLVIFSFSRRRGPVRDLPAPVRATPVEFLEALGSLYAEARASSTSVELAYERFRRRMTDLCGLKGTAMSADELSAAVRRRFPKGDEALEKDLAECQEVIGDETLPPKKALALVQALSRHGEALEAAARAGRRLG